MKRTAKALSVLLALALLLSLAPAARAAVSGACGANLTWEYSDGTLTISGTGAMADYSSGFRVPWSQYRDKITSVVIENGCTQIGKFAFQYHKYITSVSLPDSGLKSIGEWAFASCEGLESITLPGGLTSIGDWTFEQCEKLKNITLPDSVTQIGEWAFAYCHSLESVNIPEGVKALRRSVFLYCEKLNEITLPASLATLDAGSFFGCTALAAFRVASGSKSFCTQGGVLFSKDMITLVAYPCGRTNSGGKPAESYDIPSGVQKIGEQAFCSAKALKSVGIPDSVKELGEKAFYSSGLTSVTIPDSVTTIGHGVFMDCTALQSFTLPDDITEISSSMFCNCTALESVVLPDTVTRIGSTAFMRCDALRYIILQDGVESIDRDAFDSCAALAWITIPSSVTSIGRGAFDRCPALSDVYYAGDADAWEAIDLKTDGNKALTNAAMHYGTDFGVCGVGLKWLLTEQGTLHIFGAAGSIVDGGDWDGNKDKVKAVMLEPGISGIGAGAFKLCAALEYAVIPESVTSIGRMAFGGCKKLIDIYYGSDLTHWNQINSSTTGIPGNTKIHYNTTGPWTAINAAVWRQMIDYCTVQNVPAGAVLLAARYNDEGRMTGVCKVWEFIDSTDYQRFDSVIPPGEGNAFRLMLVDGATFAPLCAPWEYTVEASEPVDNGI